MSLKTGVASLLSQATALTVLMAVRLAEIVHKLLGYKNFRVGADGDRAPRDTDFNEKGAILHLKLELGDVHLKLGFTSGFGQKPRPQTVGAMGPDGRFGHVIEGRTD